MRRSPGAPCARPCAGSLSILRSPLTCALAGCREPFHAALMVANKGIVEQVGSDIGEQTVLLAQANERRCAGLDDLLAL